MFASQPGPHSVEVPSTEADVTSSYENLRPRVLDLAAAWSAGPAGYCGHQPNKQQLGGSRSPKAGEIFGGRSWDGEVTLRVDIYLRD